MAPEIIVIPFHGQGHILPCIELCNQLAIRDFKITLILPSHLSSSITTVDHHPLVQIADIPFSSPPPPPPSENTTGNSDHPFPDTQLNPFSQLLSQRLASLNPPICLIVDVMMGWIQDTCRKSGIPIISFFTSGACSAAMEYAIWKIQPENLKPGETLSLPGLPESMILTSSDLTHNKPPPPHHDHGGGPHHPPPPPRNHHTRGPPPPHQQGAGNRRPWQPGWVSETEDSIALLMNTCSDLEGPFLDCVSKETKKPVWGVGPLLPAQFWKSVDSLVHDGEVRAKKQSNVSEEQVQDWLDSKPRGSAIYVAFGSEVGPTADELAELANGLEESNLPFIWAIQNGAGRNGPPGPPPGPPQGHPAGDGTPGPPPGSDSGGFFPDGLESRVKGRGLVIHGWAPQLLILSHPSVAGFLSHCGWNSILEALGRGVPLLAWPIRGDQHYNAKLVVSHLKVGLMLRRREGAVNKSDIVEGIEKLIGEAEIKKRAGNVRSIFAAGFPASSLLSLDAFRDFSLRIAK